MPSRTRPGDQALPQIVDGPAMQDLVIADIENRKMLGIERYGQLLKAYDGRNNNQDVYEELLDLVIYFRKKIYEETWKPMDSAPKDRTRIDIWAKAWLPAFDKFAYQRFPDCYWYAGDTMSNANARWMDLHKDWHPLLWIKPLLPKEPSE